MAEWEWKTGEHITTIGPTGSGKTVLNRYLLRRSPVERGYQGPYVVVLGIKNRDPELYGPFQSDGYELVRKFDAVPPEDAYSQHLIFAPRTTKAGKDGLRERETAFRHALNDVERHGGWTVCADDLQFMTEDLRLGPDFSILWKIGRSEQVSLLASSQEPIQIPVTAYGSATHLFLFKNPDVYRAKRMAELTGINREIAQATILRLPDHEFLYINKSTGQLLRSMVIR